MNSHSFFWIINASPSILTFTLSPILNGKAESLATADGIYIQIRPLDPVTDPLPLSKQIT